MRRQPLLLMIVALLLYVAPARAQTVLGDWGHFSSYYPKRHLLNPEGRAFNVTFHFMLWPVEKWNKKAAWIRVTGPGDKELIWKEFPVAGNRLALDIPAAGKGVYTVELGARKDGRFGGATAWMESDLDHSVLWTGEPASDPADKKNAIEKRRAVFQASVPRKWWFWVPPETNTFTVRAQRCDRYMSQREDWGFSIYSPRGQRVQTLFGQPPKSGKPEPYRQEMVRTVEVEPGAAGRFWAIEVRLGDSHHHSNINFALDGVPPFIARSPEEWFNATTGKLPDVPLYDETPYVQAAYEPKNPERWPHLQHWSPCPSLGDPDGIEIRGDAAFSLWNPEGRELRFMIGDYLPRGRFKNPPKAQVGVAKQDRGAVTATTVPVPHYHGHGKPPAPLPGLEGKGLFKIDVVGAERWWAFTYPATPLVYLGHAKDDWAEWTFEVGTVRNWYFCVPKGTKQFEVRANAAHDTDVMHLEVNAPDRTLALIYASEGEATISVPPGLDGKIWHLRTDVGSATRMITAGGGDNRYVGIYLTVGLQGVPGCLSPTWEQWFDPHDPQPPLVRGEKETK